MDNEIDSFGWSREAPSSPCLTEIVFGPGVFTPCPENDVRRYAFSGANYVPKLMHRDFLTGVPKGTLALGRVLRRVR